MGHRGPPGRCDAPGDERRLAGQTADAESCPFRRAQEASYSPGGGPRTHGAVRVLLSAYACEPNRGSEPGVGWGTVQALAAHHEVWALTRANNRPAIERETARTPMPSVHFVYYDLPRWARWWKHGQRGRSCTTTSGNSGPTSPF